MPSGRADEVLRAFLRLGLTSFGGPVAHLGYFRDEFVTRRRWLADQPFTDLVALCQFLPGPASSQLGFAIGLHRAGWLGGLAAWAGFTLPSAAAMLAFALGASGLTGPLGGGILHGLKLVAVSVVAQAVLGMSRTLCPDRTRASIAALAAALVLGTAWPQAQLVVVAAGALLGVWLCRDAEAPGTPAAPRAGTRRAALWALAVFAVLLVVAEVAPLAAPPGWVALSSAFYRAGALVFGGGHVVLPLLTSTVVEPGWVGREAFLSGYGMAQAVPGPLFTVAAYLGAVASPLPGVGGGLVALVAIFLPGLLLLAGTLPFWEALRAQPHARAALRGVNAAVVGMLGAALYDPLWVSAVHGPSDVVIALIAFVGLVSVRLPSVAIVLFGIAAGAVWGG